MTDPATAALDAPVLSSALPEERTAPAWGAVVSLALGVFGLVTAEFLPASLLTPMAHDLGVSEGAAGQAVTATAIVGAIAAPSMAIMTHRLDRKVLMWVLTLLLIVSSLIAAFASSLTMLLGARVVLGIALGGFWAMSGAMTMRLVPAYLLPRAMSIVLAGVSVATVCAAPIGAYVGDIWGWRSAFLIAAIVGAVTLLVQVATIPSLPPAGVAGLRTLLDVAKRPAIRVGLLFILLIASGHFAGFTYVRAFLEKVPVFDVENVSLVLLAFGIGGFFGNLAGGFLVERSLKLAAGLAPLLIAISSLLLLVYGASPAMSAIAVTTWGFAFGAIPVAVQTWMVRAAPDHAESAGGLMVAAFQVAIAMGAIFGGLLVDNAGVASAFGYAGLATLLAAVTAFLLGPKKGTFA
ncbi:MULTISPECIES: MFS transporter [Phyllobacteriaceae]|jgi:predicted MFS family arabinose efflux permease|uniref:Transporter n=1 Tax=Mesorhizobium hungaricum TaxID=1566387 RepID=A0A1C2DVH3_9HYPH|nr:MULTISPECIES: MFS transporter [Mesorhizobium]MBN9234085.1 MFS transporter [Mesorhizobium sp.]MDQ0331620.1 DHA1 family purine ribonucleoside efflux pump-like MFS transporter [Mesorhizobium sp. YL-MeA3-2017]OCX18762.1 transporter [Mesorhizobium hungaricum]